MPVARIGDPDMDSGAGVPEQRNVESGAGSADPGRRRARDRGALARRRVAVWGGVLLALSWAIHGWAVIGPGLQTRTGEIKGADYVQFFLMASLLREGHGARLYDTTAIAGEAKRRITPRMEFHPERNPYGPQVALMFRPLAALPYLPSLIVFSLLSLGAYVAGTWLLWRHAPALVAEGPYVALLAAACPALLFTLRFGQISTLTLLPPVLALAALAAGRHFVAGLCLGFLAYKPQLLVVAVPALLVARDWRSVGGVLTMAAGHLAAGWIATGSGAMQQYGATLVHLTGRPDLVMLYPENAHSLRGFLRLLGVPAAWATAVTVVLIPPCALALARVWRADVTPLMRMGALVIAMLLLSPHLLSYDLLLLVVPITALVDWAATHRDDPRARGAIIVAVLLYLAPFSSIQARHTHLQLSSVVMAAAAVIIATLVWRPAGPRRDAAESSDRTALT